MNETNYRLVNLASGLFKVQHREFVERRTWWIFGKKIVREKWVTLTHQKDWGSIDYSHIETVDTIFKTEEEAKRAIERLKDSHRKEKENLERSISSPYTYV